MRRYERSLQGVELGKKATTFYDYGVVLTETVIAEDGYPILLRVPDPAAFALHKLWVSQRQDRKKDKASRDKRQALALAQLIRERIPMYDFAID